MNSNVRAILIPSLLLGVPLTFVLLWGSGSLNQRVPPGMTESAEAATAMHVKTLNVGFAAHAESIELNGTVAAENAALIAGKLLATVTALHVKEGEAVRAGQLLVSLDARDLAAQAHQATAAAAQARAAGVTADESVRAAEMGVSQAQAQADLAATTYERVKNLHADGSASVQSWNEAESHYKVATAALKQARLQLATARARRLEARAGAQAAEAGVNLASTSASYAAIVAPFDGIVVKKFVSVGAMAAPGSPLIQVERGPFRLDVAVPERLASRLKVGSSVEVTVDALGTTTQGHIASLVPAVDPMSRTAIAKISLPTLASLASGMDGRARFALGKSERLMIPASSVVKWYHLTSAFTVEDGEAALRFVRLGEQQGGQVEVLSGLDEGDRLIVDNMAGLRDGMKVEVTP